MAIDENQEVESPKAEEQAGETPEAEVDAHHLPDDWWLTYCLDEIVPLVFPDAEGQIIETVEALWQRDNIFEVNQTPLKVDGVVLGDLVEVRWEEGDLTPIFVRIKEHSGYKRIKVDLSRLRAKDKSRFSASLHDRVGEFRLDGNLLIITYSMYPSWTLEQLARWDVSWELVDEED